MQHLEIAGDLGITDDEFGIAQINTQEYGSEKPKGLPER